MPRRKFIDKKTATTFSLVHRAQNDPLIHDESAPSMVFAEKQAPSRPPEDDYAYSDTGSVISGTASYRSSKARQRCDLEEEFGLGFKPNEGEAAQHGVFYDDTEYDYMQHMRDLGGVEGPVTLVESSASPEKKKGKQRLEDALRDMEVGGTCSVLGSAAGESVASSARSLLPEEVLPSEFVTRWTHQDQQDIPDEIAGFQPDMDPRLREVLEALEDEDYVDDKEDIFGELTKDGYEVDRDEWERLGEQQVFDDDAGWESDDTIRAASPPPAVQPPGIDVPEGEPAAPPVDAQAQPPADPTEGAWLDEFNKFKHSAKAAKLATNPTPAQATPSALDASVLSSLASGRHKKRKGAKTSTTNYSMTSSALARTDHQTLLDSRFDKILENEDMMNELANDQANQLPDTASLASCMTGMSKASRVSKYSNVSGLSGMSGVSSYSRATEAPQLERADFDGIMDDFLGGHSKAGKGGRKIKRFGSQTGMQQLDEVRQELGPARVKSRQAA